MKKSVKIIIITVAIAAIIGVIIAYFCKMRIADSEWEDDDDFFDDIAIDDDHDAAEREYVPLNKETTETAKEETEKAAE